MRQSVFAVACVAFAVLAGGTAASARPSASALTATSAVVVPRGQPIQIAFVGSSDFSAFTHDIRDGIEMAVE